VGSILGGDTVHLSDAGWEFCSEIHTVWDKGRRILEEWVHAPQEPGTGATVPTAEPGSEAKAVIACTDLAEKVQLMRAVGLPVPASMLEWLYPGSPLLSPRKGYRTPDATLEVGIPMEVLQSMRPEVPVTQEAFPDLFEPVTAVTMRRWSGEGDKTVRRRIQISVQALQGRPPARQHQWNLGAQVTFLTGLPNEQNALTGASEPLATRVKLTVRGPRHSHSIADNASFSKEQPTLSIPFLKWDSIVETGPCTSGARYSCLTSRSGSKTMTPETTFGRRRHS